MIPLDSVVPLAQVYGVSVGLAVVVSMGYGRWVQRYESERAATKLDRAERLGRWYSVGVVFVCVIWFDAPATVRQAVGVVSPFSPASFPAALAVTVAFVGLIALNVLLWYVPLAVARVAAVDTAETVGERLAVFGVEVFMMGVIAFLPGAVVFSPTVDVTELLASLVAAEVLWLLLAAEYTMATHRTAPPSAAERERLEAAFSNVEFDPQTIRTIPLDTNRNGMMLHDIPGRQLVLVSDYFLSVASDDQLRVAATQVDYFSRTWFREGRMAVLSGALLACVWLISPLAPASTVVGLLLAVLACCIAATLLWRLSGTYHRADDAIADRIGARRLLEYHEWWLDASDAKRDHGLFHTVLSSEPPVERRLERLREMVDDDPSATDRGPPPADDPNPAD